MLTLKSPTYFMNLCVMQTDSHQAFFEPRTLRVRFEERFGLPQIPFCWKFVKRSKIFGKFYNFLLYFESVDFKVLIYSCKIDDSRFALFPARLRFRCDFRETGRSYRSGPKQKNYLGCRNRLRHKNCWKHVTQKTLATATRKRQLQRSENNKCSSCCKELKPAEFPSCEAT